MREPLRTDIRSPELRIKAATMPINTVAMSPIADNVAKVVKHTKVNFFGRKYRLDELNKISVIANLDADKYIESNIMFNITKA
jgi:hypothetical protein